MEIKVGQKLYNETTGEIFVVKKLQNGFVLLSTFDSLGFETMVVVGERLANHLKPLTIPKSSVLNELEDLRAKAQTLTEENQRLFDQLAKHTVAKKYEFVLPANAPSLSMVLSDLFKVYETVTVTYDSSDIATVVCEGKRNV